MITINMDKTPQVSDEMAVAFLSEAIGAVMKFKELHEYLTVGMNGDYTSEVKDLGILQEEFIMYKMDELIGGLPMDNLYAAINSGFFGKGPTKSRLAKACAIFEQYQADIVTRNSIASPMSLVELQAMVPYYGFVIGDMTYALISMLHVNEMLDALLSKEELCLDSALSAYCVSRNITVARLAMVLVELRKDFPSVVPVFDQCPNDWKKICDTLESSIVQEIIDYGEYVYLIDVKAYNNGDLKFDENYIALLEERQNNPPQIADDFPDSWHLFQTKVPEKMASRVLAILPQISHGLIAPILQNGEVTEDFIQLLEKACTGNLIASDFESKEVEDETMQIPKSGVFS